VTDGIQAALARARAAAGAKDEGVRLFEELGSERIELRKTGSIETPGATHLRLEPVK
jgi:hypothetical protein